MTHTYQLTGMTCGNCEKTVKSKLLAHPDITDVSLSREEASATITLNKHLSTSELQQLIGGEGSKYQISNIGMVDEVKPSESWFITYKPILLVFAFILGTTLMVQFTRVSFDIMEWMRHFMAGFFLVFAFFKVLDIPGFAASYADYDIVAKRIPQWGFIYPFVEVALGLAYLVNFHPVLTNATTFIVMSVSIIGVLQSVLNKRKIKCACLGTGFNLPMSTVTIIEDGLMIVMAGSMLIYLL